MNKGFAGFCFSILLLTAVLSLTAYSQDPPLGAPRPTPAPLASTVLENAFARLSDGPVSREQREKAYAKLLEGQRFLETAKRAMTQNEYQVNVRLSKASFQNAVELDPTLAEAYTAIAELSTIDEAVKIAVLALKVNPDSFAAHRMLGRVYTLKSRLTEVSFDRSFAEKAITEWKEVARLDPRGSEPWAYLSELYNRTGGRPQEELEALNKWIGSVAPAARFENDFFHRATGVQDLAPERALLRLARVLLKANRDQEALEVISRKIADEPENDEAVELLKQALEKTGKGSTAQVIGSLQQAVYANPSNVSLVEVLAGIQARAGMTDDAVKTLQGAIDKLDKGEKLSIARLQLTMGDIYADAGSDKEAVAAYEASLKTTNVDNSVLNDESDRFFATQVLSSIIQLHKNAQRFEEAKAAIEHSRVMFGKEDPFADLQLLKLLRDSGKKAEALRTVRGLRQKTPSSDEYFYQEAYILTDLGRVEEAVAMIKARIVNKGRVATAPQSATRDINNYLTISGLYSQAKQGAKAVDAAQTALALAQNEDLKQVVLLTLATAQNEAGDFKSAEKTLRDVLEKTPDNTTALNNLGYFLADRGEKLEEALQMIQKAVKSQPENSSFLDSLGWAYFKLGNYEEAEKNLKEANRRDGSSSAILDHLGDVYAKQGKLDLARLVWQKALNLTSDNAEVAKIKAKLGKKSGR